MILYFSGTGNSEYAAKKLGKELQDETVNLLPKIQNNDASELTSEKAWVIVTPTYAWRIPHILEEWLSKTALSGSRDGYFVLTCGGSIGNAGSYVKKLCRSIGMNCLGCIPVVMPENYIALFSTPTKDEALKTLRLAETAISRAALLIKNGETYAPPAVTFGDRLSSGIVNTMFYPLFVHDKKFHVTDRCISCGLCVKNCPLNNIRLENGKPQWGGHCTHCMACICRCPKEAIEYGKNSKNKPRYVCPLM